MSTATIRCPAVHDTAVEFRVTGTNYREASLSSFNRFVTFIAQSGACGLQTYLTPDEAEELAGLLVKCALEVREQQVQKVAA